MDLLFEDLGLTLAEKQLLARREREGFGREFTVDGTFRAQVGQRYRAERTHLEALLDPDPRRPAPLTRGLEALHRRSLQLTPVTEELRRLAQAGRLSTPITDLAASFAHMHLNRLLRSAHRAHELVLYELLDRAYSTQAGRRTEVP
jgi:lantibiotic biosynthesis protein